MEQIDSQEVVTSNDDAMEARDSQDNTQVEVEQQPEAKPQVESKEAKIARLKRQLDRLTKDEQPAQRAEQKQPSLQEDYGKLAYLAANGVKGKKELELVEQYMGFGKTLNDIVENKYFLNDLKELREDGSAKTALPSGSKRSTPSPRDSVQYWLMKGELPPQDQAQLRRDVVNAKIKAESGGTRFTNNPVGSGIVIK